MRHQFKPILLTLLLIFSTTLFASGHQNRLGIGISNQLTTGMPAISFKLQKSSSFAMGGLLGMSTSENNGGYGAGLKIYRIIFDEPQLTFYASTLGALFSRKNGTESQSGFQVDLTLGSEFSFVGLESIGFSFEFGISMNKVNDFIIETVGNHFISAGIHFYL